MPSSLGRRLAVDSNEVSQVKFIHCLKVDPWFAHIWAPIGQLVSGVSQLSRGDGSVATRLFMNQLFS